MPRCSVFEGDDTITHTNRNFVLAYILLVGLPLLGLVAVLKSGRNLIAPYAIDGAWKIESSRPSPSACGNLLAALVTTPLSISQSGKALVVTLSGGADAAAGMLNGKTVEAHFPGAEVAGKEKNGAECGEGGVTLTATLDPMAEPRTMSGTFSVEGCGSCTPVVFHAIRQPKSPGGTR